MQTSILFPLDSFQQPSLSFFYNLGLKVPHTFLLSHCKKQLFNFTRNSFSMAGFQILLCLKTDGKIYFLSKWEVKEINSDKIERKIQQNHIRNNTSQSKRLSAKVNKQNQESYEKKYCFFLSKQSKERKTVQYKGRKKT